MPSHAHNRFDQGVEALELENYTAAVSAFEQWLSEYPEDVDALHNLGLAEYYCNHFSGALRAWSKALTLAPDNNDLHSAILEVGDQLQSTHNKTELSGPFFELLIDYPQYHLTATVRLAYYYNFTNQPQKALKILHLCQQEYPRNLALKLQEIFLTPIVYYSPEEMDWWHTHLSQKLDELEAWLKEPETLTSGPIFTFTPIFNLMPMGRNDRQLLQRISNVWRQIFVPQNLKPFTRTPQSTTRQSLKLGIVSGTVYDHSTMHYFQGMFEQISKAQDIDAALFYFGDIEDETTQYICAQVNHVQKMPPQLLEAVALISDWQADVIFYLDIGMDSFLYTLAHIRMAPAQCVSAGVPMTTGISTIDYYVSSRWFEPAQNASDNYSESLICLDDLMVNMIPPALNQPLKSRADLGLSEDKHLYFFPHSLIRVDPELDTIFAQILHQDPRAEILFIQDDKKKLHEQILKRFQKKYPAEVDRIRFLPWVNQKDFLNILACSDVALDSLRLGGGNVTFQSFYVGTPVIQLPTSLLRCRIATGLYQILDMTEWIAQDRDDYVQKALLLGNNPLIRNEVSKNMLAGRKKIFNQTAGVEHMLNHFRAWGKAAEEI